MKIIRLKTENEPYLLHILNKLNSWHITIKKRLGQCLKCVCIAKIAVLVLSITGWKQTIGSHA